MLKTVPSDSLTILSKLNSYPGVTYTNVVGGADSFIT